MCKCVATKNRMWKLLRCVCPMWVYHTVRKCTNWYNSPTCYFHLFIQKKVIQIFKHQRGKYESRFAVIFVVNKSDTHFGTLWFKETFKFYKLKANEKGLECTKLVNSSEPYYPKHSYGNYIVARSDQMTSLKCAENFLLDNFYKIWSSSRDPRYIVLYAWDMPCTSCTQDIISKLTTYKKTNSLRIIVAYSKSLEGRDTRRNIRDLQTAGFTVTHVKFNQSLDEKTVWCTCALL